MFFLLADTRHPHSLANVSPCRSAGEKIEHGGRHCVVVYGMVMGGSGFSVRYFSFGASSVIRLFLSLFLPFKVSYGKAY